MGKIKIPEILLGLSQSTLDKASSLPIPLANIPVRDLVPFSTNELYKKTDPQVRELEAKLQTYTLAARAVGELARQQIAFLHRFADSGDQDDAAALQMVTGLWGPTIHVEEIAQELLNLRRVIRVKRDDVADRGHS
ncbi:MAG: hypothetical protein Q9169_003371 [Polycauliona sp. 2 TL-2023]